MDDILKPKTITFENEKGKISIPLSPLIQVPNLMVDKITVDFNFEVAEAKTEKSKNDGDE